MKRKESEIRIGVEDTMKSILNVRVYVVLASDHQEKVVRVANLAPAGVTRVSDILQVVSMRTVSNGADEIRPMHREREDP